MANPQIENGFTKIANEILDILAKTDLNGTQRRILDVIFRQTYGFQRKKHELSITFLAKATDLNKRQIQRELNELIKRNIVIEVEKASFNKPRTVAFNKRYRQWNSRQVAEKLPPNEIDIHTGSELDTSTGSELDVQRKKVFKENIKDIVEYLNTKTGKAFTVTANKTVANITARLNEGYEVEDFKVVIDVKTKQWLRDENMNKYLRPETLFGTKFEGYLNEKVEEKLILKEPFVPKFVFRDL